MHQVFGFLPYMPFTLHMLSTLCGSGLGQAMAIKKVVRQALIIASQLK